MLIRPEPNNHTEAGTDTTLAPIVPVAMTTGSSTAPPWIVSEAKNDKLPLSKANR